MSVFNSIEVSFLLVAAPRVCLCMTGLTETPPETQSLIHELENYFKVNRTVFIQIFNLIILCCKIKQSPQYPMRNLGKKMKGKWTKHRVWELSKPWNGYCYALLNNCFKLYQMHLFARYFMYSKIMKTHTNGTQTDRQTHIHSVHCAIIANRELHHLYKRNKKFFFLSTQPENARRLQNR